MAGYLVGAVLTGFATLGPDPVLTRPDAALTVGLTLPAVVLGLLIVRQRPRSPVGPALIMLTAAPSLAFALEDWGASRDTARPWWGADVGAVISPGVWVFNLAGFVLLCLTFPDGRLPGRRWAALPGLFLVAAGLVTFTASASGPDGTGKAGLPGPAWAALVVIALGSLLAVLAGAVSSLVLRYRRGDPLTRLQLRWLSLGAASVPVLLAAGWGAQVLGASVGVAYTGFMIALLVVLPATVAVAVLRHDLLDLDRLLSSSAAWALTSVVSAAVFAVVVLGSAELTGRSGGSSVSVTAAAFVTAAGLLPVHRRLEAVVGRVFDRERTVSMAAMRQFVHQVRDGAAQPEAVEQVLRDGLDDPDLRVLLTVPGSDGYVDLSGAPYPRQPVGPAQVIELSATGSPVAVLVLGWTSARRTRRARELAVEARLPIEVSRLRLELRAALADARAGRVRLVEAAAVERQQLERDLHDGAQQRILAVGMRLRSVQRRHPPGDPTHQELDDAVAALEATVAELRRLAHGIRPSGLDDGLEAAIRSLISAGPIPVEVAVDIPEVSESVSTAAYFVVAESLANTLKHARATSARVSVTRAGGPSGPDGGRDGGLVVEVSDDGCGGAEAAGLTALRDRVAALGGTVQVRSPAGHGTTIRAEL